MHAGGRSLAELLNMSWICEHCSAPFEGSAYWVTSEDSGVILLNMVVCQFCRIEAEKLGLHTEELSGQSYFEFRRHKRNLRR